MLIFKSSSYLYTKKRKKLQDFVSILQEIAYFKFQQKKIRDPRKI